MRSAAEPLLCAGITVWESLRALDAGPGTRVAVVGLGHLAVKLAVALGAETMVVSRSAAKAADASRLGARELLVPADPGSSRRAGTCSTSSSTPSRCPTTSARTDVGGQWRPSSTAAMLDFLADLG